MIAKDVSVYDLFTIDREEEYRYVEVEGGIKVIGYSGVREYIEIPETINGKKVVAIGLSDEGYPGSMDFKILIPNTVEYVDPKSNPASYDTWYSKIYLKKDNDFYCIEKDILYSKDKKTLYMFFDKSVENLIVEESVENIAENAFYQRSFKSIKLPSNLKSIGNNAFASQYTAFEIPKSVEFIGDNISYNYTINPENKNYVVIDGCVYTKDEKTLVKCLDHTMLQVAISNTVETIRPYAFREMRINKLELGEGVLNIGEFAFDFSEIKTIRIPDQVEHVADTAFGFNKCNSVRVEKNNKHFYSDGTCFFSTNSDGEKRLIKCFKNKEVEYTIPEGTVSIAPKAFCECTGMEKIIFPNSLKVFNENCLLSNRSKCAVKKIEIPENVCELDISSENYEYDISKDNKNYYVEDGILYHKNSDGIEIVLALKDLSSELKIKDDVVRIKKKAFFLCNKISKVICGNSLKIIEHNAFSNGWDENNIEEIELNDGLEYIDYLAFAGCKVGKVHIPSSVKYMSISAFNKCEKMEYDVDINNNYYTSKDGCLFNKQMTELKYVPKLMNVEKYEVPSSVIEIGKAFRGCKKINEIVLPQNVTCIWCNGIECTAKNLYVNGDIKYFDYTGIDFWSGITIHAKAETGAAQYVKWINELRSDAKVFLVEDNVENNIEDVSKLTNDFRVALNETGLTILKLMKPKINVEIPEKIGDYFVTKIASNAFVTYHFIEGKIKEISIPDTVTEIGANAFGARRNLEKIKLPKNIKKIANGLFRECKKLEEIIIPEGVEEIGVGVFFGCENLKKIYFPKSINKISDFLFSDENGDFKDLYLRESTIYVVEKDSYAENFLRNYKPENFERLSVVYSEQIGNVDVEEDKTYLEYLDYVIQEDSTVAVCLKSNLNAEYPDIVIPSNIQGLPVTKLKEIKKIHNFIETIYIPSSIQEIEGFWHECFSYGNKNLKCVKVAENNLNYWSDGKALYTKDKSVLIHVFDYQAESYEVNESTKIIKEKAFENFSNLKKIILPACLTEIQSNVFNGCLNLEEIIGIENVSKIAENVLLDTAYYKKSDILFNGTILQKYNKLTDEIYVIPEGTTEIAKNAFLVKNDDGDILEKIIVPSSIKKIENHAFSGRKKLKEIIIQNGVEEIQDNAFYGCVSLKDIYIPTSIKNISLDAFPGYMSQFHAEPIIPIFSSINVDDGNEFYSSIDGILYSKDKKILIKVPVSLELTELIIPESVEIIGEQAFYGNQFIKKVILTENVNIIESLAFKNCCNLEEINLENVKEIKTLAFENCEKLTQVELNLLKIEEYTFENCKCLTSVKLNNTKIICASAFKNCGITAIDLPEGLTEIGDAAFAKCNFKTVVVPKTVLKIENESFSGCTEITIYDTIAPDAKPCTEHLDSVNGSPNSAVGFIGIGPSWAMWECAANHKWIDHEIIVRSAENDEIKYKVWMGANPTQRKYYCTLTSSWGKNASFNFCEVDKMFSEIKNTVDKIKIAIYRLKYPVMLHDIHKNDYIKYLVRLAKDVVIHCIYNDDMESLMFCESFGILKKNNIDELLEYATKRKAKQFIKYLKNYKETNFVSKSTKKK